MDFFRGLLFEYGIRPITIGIDSYAANNYEAAVLAEQLVRNFPAVVEYSNHLARVFQGLGGLKREAGREDEARQSYERARAIWERLVKDFPQVKDYQNNLKKLQTEMEKGKPD